MIPRILAVIRLLSLEKNSSGSWNVMVGSMVRRVPCMFLTPKADPVRFEWF